VGLFAQVTLDAEDGITRMTQADGNTTTSERLTTVLWYGALLLLGYLVFRPTFRACNHRA
jgi:hypothetical protein